MLQLVELENELGTPISIVIPAHNESRHIAQAMQAISTTFSKTQWNLEIIVVDDGSEDDTRQVALAAARDLSVSSQIISLPSNLGKGRAVREGFRVSRGEYVGFVDADLEYPVNALPLMLDAIQKSPNSCAIATRVEDSRPFIERWSSRIAHKLASTLLRLPIYDTQAGMKVFPGTFARNVLADCSQNGWLYDIEVLLKAVENRMKIVEVPVGQQSIRPRRARLGSMISCAPTLVNLSMSHWNAVRKQSATEIRQLLRFTAVGLMNTVTNLTAFWLLSTLWASGYSGVVAGIEALAAWLIASIVGYTLHSRYTFQRLLSRRGFYLVTGLGVIIETLVTGTTAQIFGYPDDIVGKLVGMALASSITYGGYRLLAKKATRRPRKILVTRLNIAPITDIKRLSPTEQ